MQRQLRDGGRARYDALLERLTERLTERGHRTVVAGMTLPNVAGEGLHGAMGVERVGIHPEIGWELDAWHDVAVAQRALGTGGGPPTELR
jgi:L-amino acid N-acyltransferase YncA